MSATTTPEGTDLTQSFIRFYRTYYDDAIADLAQHYPTERRALRVTYADLAQFDHDLAADWVAAPGQIGQYADEALHQYDLPAAVALDGSDDPDHTPAAVRLVDLPADRVYYPGGYSPSEAPGEYVALRGEVAMATDVYSRITEAAFECQRCGTPTHIPQDGTGFQEPHECHGCDRQGPFEVNFDQSAFVDAQSIRLQEPPSVAGGEGATVDVYVEQDLAGRVETGDEVVVYGTLHLRQVTEGRDKTSKFETYLDGCAMDFEESSGEDLDITSEERQDIRDLAARADALDAAAASLAPRIYGHDHVKRAAILQLVGGTTVAYGDGSTDRGDIHLLLIGDPSTGKSKLVDAVREIAPRAAAVSASNTGKAGLTASAVRDDFGDGEWSLKPGAFAKANGGIVCVEELDDLEAEKRAAMLEPMSKQSIAVSKAGINTTLQTRVAVIAAANPKHGRFDPYEPVTEQFTFGSAMLSRFDLIYTFRDDPDPDDDADIATHVAGTREAGKRRMRGDDAADDGEYIDPPVDADTLRKWLALANRQDPPAADDDALADARKTFVRLRGANGYDHDDPVPVTMRSWEAILRIAEAAAKLEFSATVDQRHFEIATDLVGRSMQDIGKNEDDQFDADVVETGTSTPQRDRKQTLETLLRGLSDGGEPVAYEVLYEEAAEQGIDQEAVDEELRIMREERGWVIEPTMGETVKWIGRA